MEIQKTLNSQSNLEKEEWNWRNQPAWLQALLKYWAKQWCVRSGQERDLFSQILSFYPSAQLQSRSLLPDFRSQLKWEGSGSKWVRLIPPVVLLILQVTQWSRIRLPMQEMRETWVRSLGRDDPLEKEMATLCSILAWKKSHGQRSLVGYSP